MAITGGGGFIGRHLVARHLALGDRVRYLTRNASAPHLPGAMAYIGDLAAPETLRAFVQGADVLYHCAAELHDLSSMELINIQGTENLLAVAEGQVGRWVQLSSCGVYGRHRQGVVREGAVLQPSNPYERSKAAADRVVLQAAKRGLQCVLLRPSNVYGSDMPNRSLFQLVSMINRGMFCYIGQCGAVANYIHVDNVIDALLLCANSALRENGSAYIVSDHRTLEEFVEEITGQLGKKRLILRLPEMPVRLMAAVCGVIPGCPLTRTRVDALTNRAVYCAEKIHSDFGYRHQISMEQGLALLVKKWKCSAP